MKSRLFVAAATIAVAALALTACSGTPDTGSTASEKNPFHYVYIGGITGGQASLAATEILGAQIAINKINKEGGILGRKVVMETLDTKSDPTEAVSVLQKRLSSGDKPDLIRAGLASTEALAMVPITTRAGIPTYTASATPLLDDVKAYPYNKQISSTFTSQVHEIKNYVLAQGYKTLSVLAPEDASGDSTIASVEAEYKDSGVKIETTRYNTADVDVSVAYQRAIADNPDAVYANCLGAPCVRIITARGSVANGTDIPMLGDGSMASAPGGVAASVSPDLVKNLHILVYNVQLQLPESKQTADFKYLYKELLKQGPPAVMSPPSEAYDGLRMFAAAAEKAKSVDAKKLIDAINSTKHTLTTYGPVDVKYVADSAYPVLPHDAFAVIEASPLVDGLYPPLNVFSGKK